VELFGHVVRMDGERTVRKLLEGKTERGRTKGRARIRWMDDVEQDLTNMRVKRCRATAVDRKELVSVAMEAMAKLKGAEMLKRKQNMRNFFNVKKHIYCNFLSLFLSLHRAFLRFTYYHIPTNALIISFII
jgi:hypothetical protein